MTDHMDDDELDEDFEDEVAGPGNRREAALAEDVLRYVVKAIVDNPDEVDIDVEVDRRGDVQLTVACDPDDIGKVVGRRGRVIKSIRPVVEAAATLDRIRVRVEIEG